MLASPKYVPRSIERVFARQKGPMGLFMRTIGLARATTKIGLANLVYNIKPKFLVSAQTIDGQRAGRRASKRRIRHPPGRPHRRN